MGLGIQTRSSRSLPSRLTRLPTASELATGSDGQFVVEQQAYYMQRDGRISWMRVLCSGFRRDTSP